MSGNIHISKRYEGVQGGLFSKVTKADVGDNFASMEKDAITLMGWADPFYPDPSLPDFLKKNLIELVDSGISSHYTLPVGDPELRRRIAEKLLRFNHIQADPMRNIIVTPGSDSGLFYALSAVIDPGDEVLVPDPSYPNNFLDVQILGGKAVSVPLEFEEGYQLNLERFKAALTPRTRVVVLTHPNNPTTTVFRRDNLEALASFIQENDLMLVVDQAFEDSVFDGVEFVSPAALPGMWERTISVFSISKGMGLSGFRVGYVVADDHIMDILYGAAVNVLGATNTLSQKMAIAAFDNSGFLQQNIAEFDERRRSAYEILSAVPGVRMQIPESGFFSWLDVSALGDSTEIMDYILQTARVAVNDGKNYGQRGTGFLRIIHGCLGTREASDAALCRIADALRKLS